MVYITVSLRVCITQGVSIILIYSHLSSIGLPP